MLETTESARLLTRFSADGFVVVPGFLVGSALSELLSHVDQFIATSVPKMPPEQVFYEDKQDPSTLKQIQQLATHDPWFRGLIDHGPFHELAEQLLNGPVVTKNLQYFSKPPGVSRPTPPHQDGYYFMLDPCEAVTMWLALDAMNEQNGCLRYVRGSHKRGMRSHSRTQTLGFSQGIVDYPSEDDLACEVAVTVQPGDLIVHQALTIHRADGNASAVRSRRALGLVYYSTRARQDTVAHAAYQRQLSADLKATGKI